MNTKKTILSVLSAAFLIMCGASTSALADEDAKAAMKSDKTGTNPINFTNDFRVYNEFIWMNNSATGGEGEKNVTTVEYRTPIFDGKWQFRTRARAVSVEADLNNDGLDEQDESGVGEVDFRFLTVPYVNMKQKIAFAFGFETFLNTGEKILGSDRVSFGPQGFFVFFQPFGIKGSLIAPAYQHKFSVDEEDDLGRLEQSLFDVFWLFTSSDKQYWAMFNPQYLIDHQSQAKLGFLDLEVGMMLDKHLGTKGHSVYLRPSLGIGENRISDGSMEVGYKIIW